jgi:hypothetical protein
MSIVIRNNKKSKTAPKTPGVKRTTSSASSRKRIRQPLMATEFNELVAKVKEILELMFIQSVTENDRRYRFFQAKLRFYKQRLRMNPRSFSLLITRLKEKIQLKGKGSQIENVEPVTRRVNVMNDPIKKKQEIDFKKAELSREISYFSQLMSNFDSASKNANAAQQKIIEVYKSFTDDDARMDWLDKKHDKLVSM